MVLWNERVLVSLILSPYFLILSQCGTVGLIAILFMTCGNLDMVCLRH